MPKLLLLTALALTSSIFAQDAPLFRSGVTLVRVDAEVVDAGGAVLTELRKEDFRVFDQGAEQPVSNFSFERDPLDLILLFDLAGSMRGKLLRVVRAVELGFHELKTGDRASVMAFGQAVSEIAPFTSDFDAVNQAIVLRVLNLRFGGESSPEMAAAEAARRLQRERKSERRRAVLVISDKVGTSTGAAVAAVRELWQADAVLGELLIGRASGARVKDTRILESGSNYMADRTGGATVVAGDPGAAFQQSLLLLRRRYTLYYALPDASSGGSERKIEVRLADAAAKRFPGAQVRARTGYLVR